MTETQQQALKSIAAMLLIGTVLSVVSRNSVPLIVMIAVAWAIRQVAKDLDR